MSCILSLSLSPSLSLALYFSSLRCHDSLAAATCDRCNDDDIVVGWSVVALVKSCSRKRKK